MYLPFIGEIRQFTGDFAPRGWALCDGQLLEQKKHNVLYALLGKRFGGDDTRFAVPDLSGRIPLHSGGSAAYPLASRGGQETVTLMEAQLPAHTHQAYASSNFTPDNTGPENGFWGTTREAFSWGPGPGDQVMHPDSVKAAGEGHAHENRIPFVAVSWIIALEGIVPHRS